MSEQEFEAEFKKCFPSHTHCDCCGKELGSLCCHMRNPAGLYTQARDEKYWLWFCTPECRDEIYPVVGRLKCMEGDV